MPGETRITTFSISLFSRKFDCLLYRSLKPIVRLAMLIFCRKIIINKPELLRTRGPLLLACNHPNSFLDSVILNALFEQPVWSLARGDVFRNKTIARILHALQILPVYRTSEGVENLGSNYKTFASCLEIFRKKGVVHIFSEGNCINEWRLRPLKKGTARLAMKAWEENIPLRVLPVGFNYSSFRRFGKNVFLNFGELIERQDFDFSEPDGIRHQAFNIQLQQQLSFLVHEIPAGERELLEKTLTVPVRPVHKFFLGIPALAGWVLHAPLYWPVKKYVWKKAVHSDHYDSILTSVLFPAYALYILAIMIVAWLFTNPWLALSLAFILPFTAWACVQLKPQLDKQPKNLKMQSTSPQ